jgi:amidase
VQAAEKTEAAKPALIVDAARAIADGRLTARALTDICLDIIETHEADVKAWKFLDVDAARAQADAVDPSKPNRPLCGVPVGIKDIIDTADMPTECGSPIHQGHRPEADAACVARLRQAGAVILGKTVTTEFAAFKPPITRNPRDAVRTPGGSSSGSAAAVACGMVPAALGSQTAGSVIRPAAFCGVVGFKPSYGAIDITGVKPFAPALDTLGTFARTVDDAALVARVIGDGPLAAPEAGDLSPPRLGLCRPREWPEADAATHETFDIVLARLAAAGATTETFDMPARFADLTEVQNTIMIGQASTSLAWEYQNHADQLSDRLRAAVEESLAYPPGRLDAALAEAEACRADADALFGDYDLLITPSAAGEAPTAETTGDPMFNRIWTVLHGPCLTLPAANGPKGLPIGIQLVGRIGDDARLISWARWVETVLRS